jgi:hypothetical protein
MALRVESTMQTRLHRRRQTALEGTVDFHGSSTRRFITLELGQHEHEVLPQIPKRFHVLGKTDTLARTTDLLAGVGFKQKKHACPDVLNTMLARTALDKIWKCEQPK